MTVEVRQTLKLLLVTDVRGGVLLELNHEQVMGPAFAPSMLHDDVRQYVVGLLLRVAVSDAFKGLSHLAIAVVFAVHIPLGAEMGIHVHGKTVSGRPLVSGLKIQWRGLSFHISNGGADGGSHLFVCHHRTSYAKRRSE